MLFDLLSRAKSGRARSRVFSSNLDRHSGRLWAQLRASAHDRHAATLAAFPPIIPRRSHRCDIYIGRLASVLLQEAETLNPDQRRFSLLSLMAITFLSHLYRIQFSLLVAGPCYKIAPCIRGRLKIFSCSSPLLAVSVLLGVLSSLPLSVFSQNAGAGPTSSATESPPAVSDEIDRPSRDVPVETNPNPVNENFRRFRYNVGLTVREVYDDNINLSSTNRMGDWYTVIEPEISLGFGDSEGGFNYLAFDYVLSAYLFADQTERNGIEHLIHLGAQHDFGHLVLGLSQNVQILDGTSLNTLSNTTGVQANTDVNGPSRSNIYTTTVTASYDLTGKLFLSGQTSYNNTNYETQTLVSSQIISGTIFLNYVYSPKLVIGLGTTGGVTTNDGPTDDETFEQINARANYIVSGKISLSISAGVEFRQFGGGNAVSPVFDIAGSYQPFENTTITIAGSRYTQHSASLAGQDFEETSISLTLSQRLFRRATFSLAEGYSHSAYLSANTGNSTARSDNYFYVEPAFDINITRYWSVGVYYLYRTDLSTLAFFSFHDNQFGIRSSFIF